jgi:hypothetical protein
MNKPHFLVLIVFLLLFGSCKYSPAVSEQSLSFTYHNMPPNRPGEVYAIWVEVPPSAAPLPKPLHGLNKSKFVATFTVNDTGGMIGPDLTDAKTRIGVDYSVIIAMEISVERTDSIGAAPSSIFIACSSIIGTANIGLASLTGTDGYAFYTTLPQITGVATLASSPKTPANYKSEVYLMNATDPNTTSPGLSNLEFLPGRWRYGVWTVDSISMPPVYSFLGYVVDSASKDTKSAKDNYNYPGGKSPNDTARTLLDLTNGKSGVLLNLEPDVLASDPVTPFPAPILWGLIPLNETAFTPFNLQNISGGFPEVDVKIMR